MKEIRAGAFVSHQGAMYVVLAVRKRDGIDEAYLGLMKDSAGAAVPFSELTFRYFSESVESEKARQDFVDSMNTKSTAGGGWRTSLKGR